MSLESRKPLVRLEEQNKTYNASSRISVGYSRLRDSTTETCAWTNRKKVLPFCVASNATYNLWPLNRQDVCLLWPLTIENQAITHSRSHALIPRKRYRWYQSLSERENERIAQASYWERVRERQTSTQCIGSARIIIAVSTPSRGWPMRSTYRELQLSDHFGLTSKPNTYHSEQDDYGGMRSSHLVPSAWSWLSGNCSVLTLPSLVSEILNTKSSSSSYNAATHTPF